MKKIFMNELSEYFDNEITASGFVDNIRDLQYVIFLVLRDGTGKLQVTIEKSDNTKMVEIAQSLSLESTVSVTGILKKNENVKLNGMELIPSNIEITSVSESALPIDIKVRDNALRETRLDYRFLDLRREDNYLLFKCQTLIETAMREFWVSHGFIEIHSPKISGSSAESGAEMFKLDYFGTPAVLSQSPQFYKQMAIAGGFDKVFEIAPAFRAENSHTSYHATEINMVDVELGWIDSYEDVMDHEEELLVYVFNKLNQTYGDDIKKTFKVELTDANIKFPRITFEEAKRIIKEKYNYENSNPLDLDRKEEELISKYVKEKYSSDFVFITLYPLEARPFYHMYDNAGHTYSYDLLYKGLEITTGAQREHKRDVLINQIKSKGINPKDLEFYTDFFRYGCPPHGGFGFGMARLIMQIFEIDNIREATFVYRGPTRLNP